MTENKRYCRLDDFEHWNVVKDNVTTEIYDDAKDIADLLNELAEENEQLKQQVEDLEFELRTIKAFDRTVKEEHSDTVYDFKKKLEKW